MKDPAALLYIDKWIVATTEMKAEARAYYMDLILSQFDKGDLPNDIEELANICRVRVSEYTNFKQVFEQVLQHKFEQNSNGRLENVFAREIIQKRRHYVEKRADAGKLSYIIRYARKHLKATPEFLQYIKDNINIDEIDTKNEQVLEQMFEQMSELYINEDEDIIILKEGFENFWNKYHDTTKIQRTDKDAAFKYWKKLNKGERDKAVEMIYDYFNSLNDVRYCKKARTYLADKNFNDEFTSRGRIAKNESTNALRPNPDFKDPIVGN